MATPSEIYNEFGEAIAAHLGVDFLVATPKKGRQAAIASSMALSMPSFIGTSNTRYSLSGRVDMELIVTAPNVNDVLIVLDSVVQWMTENRGTFTGYELFLIEANPYYITGEQSPELVGYIFDIQARS